MENIIRAGLNKTTCRTSSFLGLFFFATQFLFCPLSLAIAAPAEFDDESINTLMRESPSIVEIRYNGPDGDRNQRSLNKI